MPITPEDRVRQNIVGQSRAILFGFDNADGRSVEEQEIVGLAVASFQATN
jgi:hypothetical protein